MHEETQQMRIMLLYVLDGARLHHHCTKHQIHTCQTEHMIIVTANSFYLQLLLAHQLS